MLAMENVQIPMHTQNWENTETISKKLKNVHGTKIEDKKKL